MHISEISKANSKTLLYIVLGVNSRKIAVSDFQRSFAVPIAIVSEGVGVNSYVTQRVAVCSSL